MKITDPMPKITPKVPRMTEAMAEEIKSLKVGEGVLIEDVPTARAVESFARRQGWTCARRKQESGGVKIWRVS